MLNLCNQSMSPLIKDITLSGIANILWSIWYSRNQARFDGKQISSRAAMSMVKASVSLAGNLSSGVSFNNAVDNSILRSFAVTPKLSTAPVIIEVIWKAPSFNWIKCNTDGSALGAPGMAACGGIFRDKKSASLGCFASNIGVSYALNAELMGVIIAIETAYNRGWHHLWLECDSTLAIHALSSPSVVPWVLRNRWSNVLSLTRKMHFLCSHVFREGNTCADLLANHGTKISGLSWWNSIPSFIFDEFFKNRIGYPNYRFR